MFRAVSCYFNNYKMGILSKFSQIGNYSHFFENTLVIFLIICNFAPLF